VVFYTRNTIAIEIKRKMTAAQKKAKTERKKKYEWVFMDGRQVRIKRPEMIDGMLVDDWIEQNADDIWLTQNGMYDVLDARQRAQDGTENDAKKTDNNDDPEIPF